MMTLVKDLNKKLSKSGAEAILSYFLKAYKGKIVFGTSLGVEDQVITDMISRIDKSAKIFTLDTGRVFPET